MKNTTKNIKEEVKFITKAGLKVRGWTDLLIRTFLPEPHETADNPKYRCASPMCLYKVLVVEQIESSDEFKAKSIKVEKRKQGARKAVETKLAKLHKHLDTLKFKVNKLSEEKLLKRAIHHYNEMQNERAYAGFNHSDSIDKSSDKEFLNRVQVNYLRHCMTSYEDKLNEISGCVGFGDGYFIIREKIFNEIASVYPYLAKECQRQQDEYGT